MIRPLYDWTFRLAGHRRASWALVAIAVGESSVFPIPPDLLLIPMVLADRARAWWLATICTVSSVLGGLGGYYIGAFLFEAVAKPLLEFYGHGAAFDEFRALYGEHGAWVVFTAGVTPFPYKVITITSGVVALSLPTFIIASIVARGLRFFIVAGLLWWFGPPIRDFIEKRLGLVFVVLLILLIGGFVAVEWLL